MATCTYDPEDLTFNIDLASNSWSDSGLNISAKSCHFLACHMI